MAITKTSDTADNVDCNPSNNRSFDDVLHETLSRRGMMLGLGSSFVGAGLLAGCGEAEGTTAKAGTVPVAPNVGQGDVGGPGAASTPTEPPAKRLELGFDSVPKSLLDGLVLPAGYSATVLCRLGDPLAGDQGDYANDGTDAAASFEWRAGDHHDGMHFFGLGPNGQHDPAASDRALLAINHEAMTAEFLHPLGQTIEGSGEGAVRTNPEEVRKEFLVHGVSVVEIEKKSGRWSYKRSSPFNRRITTLTPMEIHGPARGAAFMRTKYSPDGTRTRGTVNNCSNGFTPWGTYLTCEENWANYFRRTAADDARRSKRELVALKRYGVGGVGRDLWATAKSGTVAAEDDVFARWNAERVGASEDGSDDYRFAPNTFGWVVEIDPFRGESAPRKRTALGRFAHEGCYPARVTPGQPIVFYMGCDGRNEYIYKFVSKAKWDPADAQGGLEAGDKYLNEGTLFAARFAADGSGEWLELTLGKNGISAQTASFPFESQGDVLVHARLAADAAGATKMDRPEWGAVHPVNGDVYFALTNTNGSSRPLDKVDGPNPRFYNDPKGVSQKEQKGNPNGHILRFAEKGGEPSATTFTWDVYLFGARSTAAADINLSGLGPSNDFSSPDGLFFSQASPGLLFIQTDDGAFTDVTNCMLLAALPGTVGDGQAVSVSNTDGSQSKAVTTFVGKPPTPTTLRRLLVGPKECEITGITETPDGTALFVNIQHPGEDTKPNLRDPKSFGSHWPEGGLARPRSATLVITRDDGGKVALR